MASRQGFDTMRRNKSDTNGAEGSTKPQRNKPNPRAYAELSDEEIFESDPDDTTLPSMRRKFARKVKNIETLEQVAAASKWMTSMQITEYDRRKFTIFNERVTAIGLQKVWPEIIMYRSIGQISTYFLDGQVLRMYDPERDDPKGSLAENLKALDELEISVAGWVRLASEGRLRRLEELAEMGNGIRYATNAERFKAYLDKYKARHNFQTWTYDHMKMLRVSIYEVVHDPATEKGGKRAMVQSEHRESKHPRVEGSKAAFQRPFQRSPGQETMQAEEDVQARRAAFDRSRATSIDSLPDVPPPRAARGDKNYLKEVKERYEFLKECLPTAREGLKSAKAAVKEIHEGSREFDNFVLKHVEEILRDGRTKGQRWTVEAAEAQAERFGQMGSLWRSTIENKILVPVKTEQKALETVDKIRTEMRDLERAMGEQRV